MSKLQKTSVQLDSKTVGTLKSTYPGFTISEIVRLALNYVVEKHPSIQVTLNYVVEKHPSIQVTAVKFADPV